MAKYNFGPTKILTDEVVVKALSDLPSAVGGVITLEEKHYIINNAISSPDVIAWPGDGKTCQITAVNRSVWTYTGTQACFKDADGAGNLEIHGLTQFEAPNGLIFDVQAPNFDCSFQATMTPKFTNCKGLGSFEGSAAGSNFASFNNFFGTYSNFYGGLTIKNCQFQEHNLMFTSPNESIQLAYDGQTVNFTVGETVTGGTSGATGVVQIDVDGGTTGTLTLSSPTGTFVNDEALTGSSTGVAVVNGVASDTVVYTTSGTNTSGVVNYFVTTLSSATASATVFDIKSEIDPGVDSVNFNGNQTEGTFVSTAFATGSLDFNNPRVFSVGNAYFQDTNPDALVSMTGNSTATAITAANTPIKVAGTWVVEDTSLFTADTTGKMTYNGLNDLSVPIDMVFTSTIEMGGTDKATYYVAKNGSIITNSGGAAQHSATQDVRTSLVWQEKLVTGDFIEAFVENNDDGSDVIVSRAALRIN